MRMAGSAASMSETSGEFGIAMGVAVLGSVGTAVYRGGISVPDGVPADVAAATGESLAGAVAAAGHLPTELALQLLEPAREAFTNGLNVVAGVGMVGMLVAGLAALAMARTR
jgi:DHA2 family multidrug resistance protein-like MFS transporter